MRESDILRYSDRLSSLGLFGLKESPLVKETLHLILGTSKYWPKNATYPNVIVTSTIERATRFYPTNPNPIVMYDENLVDAVQAIAESLSNAVTDNTPAAFAVYRLCECFARLGHGHFSVQLVRGIFPDDEDGKPLHCPDVPMLDSLLRAGEFQLRHFDDEGFQDLRDIEVDRSFIGCVRTFILCHELAHLLDQSISAEATLSLHGLGQDDFRNNEAKIDFVGLILSLGHLRHYRDFYGEVNTSRLFGNLLVIQSIMNDLSSISASARTLLGVNNSAPDRDHFKTQLRASSRSDEFQAALFYPETLESILQTFQFRTYDRSVVSSLDHELLGHYKSYANDLSASISRMMHRAFDILWGSGTPEEDNTARLERMTGGAIFKHRDDYGHFVYTRDILLLVRKGMGRHVSRLSPSLSLNHPSKIFMKPEDWDEHRVSLPTSSEQYWQTTHLDQGGAIRIGKFPNCIAFDTSGLINQPRQ